MGFKHREVRGGELSTLAELRSALLRSLRTRYTLLVVVPLLFIALLSVAADQMGLSSLVLAQRRQEVLDQAVFRASQYDAYFLNAERAAETLASVLGKLSQPDPETLYTLLEATLEANPSFYGSAIAYARDGYPGRRLYSPYVMRHPDRLVRMDIGATGYDYTEPKWEWFAGPARSLRLHWTEPYTDTGAGEVRMVTCSAPFFRDGKLLGVATVDVELTTLRMHVNTPGDFILVTGSGKLVYGGDGNLMDMARKTGRNDQLDYARKLMTREGPYTTILHTPQGAEVAAFVPLSGPPWSYGSKVSEARLMAHDHSRLLRTALAQSLMVVGAGVVVWLVLGWVTGSLITLREEMEDFCRGKKPHIIPPDTRDEVGDLQRAFFTVTELVQDEQEKKA